MIPDTVQLGHLKPVLWEIVALLRHQPQPDEGEVKKADKKLVKLKKKLTSAGRPAAPAAGEPMQS